MHFGAHLCRLFRLAQALAFCIERTSVSDLPGHQHKARNQQHRAGDVKKPHGLRIAPVDGKGHDHIAQAEQHQYHPKVVRLVHQIAADRQQKDHQCHQHNLYGAAFQIIADNRRQQRQQETAKAHIAYRVEALIGLHAPLFHQLHQPAGVQILHRYYFLLYFFSITVV